MGLYKGPRDSASLGPDISAHGVRNVGFSIKVQAMGPEGVLAQMSFYIFMWNVITFGHDRGCPVTAIRAFMVLRGIRVFGNTCLQLKATGCADSRSRCKIPENSELGLMGIAFGSVVERTGYGRRSGQNQAGSSQEGQFVLVVFPSSCPSVTS